MMSSKLIITCLNSTQKQHQATIPLPVICIDEVNVLMKGYKGGAAMEADLDALLSFLVQVRLPLYCCV